MIFNGFPKLINTLAINYSNFYKSEYSNTEMKQKKKNKIEKVIIQMEVEW